jgi:hypothetical protein
MAFPLVIVGGPWDAGKGEAEAMYKAGCGTGGRYGSGKGSGLNPAGEGTATGRGTTAGTGSGAGAGTTVGSGKGAGSAAGSGGFPGITISGGRYGNGDGDPAGLHAALTPHHQTSYAMTITSTASSGGGLPDPQVNAPLIEALKNWTFQPPQVDRNPVALNILLGIRLPGR